MHIHFSGKYCEIKFVKILTVCILSRRNLIKGKSEFTEDVNLSCNVSLVDDFDDIYSIAYLHG